MNSNSPANKAPDHPEPREIRYTVDGESQTSTVRELTPAEIMTNAGVDAGLHYLIELRGEGKQIPYKDAPGTPIKLHNNQEFITASLAPTTVS